MVAQSVAAVGDALAQASAFAATVPLLPYGATPRMVRAALALTLAPVLLVASPDRPHPDPLFLGMIEHAVTGAAFGLSAAVVAGAVIAAGNIIDVALGSPPFLERVSGGGPFGRLYQIAFTAAFAGSGGLVILIGRFARAGGELPHGVHNWHGFTALAHASIDASLVLAGPALLAQALASIIAGIVARAAPQINGIMFSAPLASGSVLLALAAGTTVLWPALADVGRRAAELSGPLLR